MPKDIRSPQTPTGAITDDDTAVQEALSDLLPLPERPLHRRSIGSGMAVIVITTGPDLAPRSRATRYCAYLTKPIETEAQLQHLQSALRSTGCPSGPE